MPFNEESLKKAQETKAANAAAAVKAATAIDTTTLSEELAEMKRLAALQQEQIAALLAAQTATTVIAVPTTNEESEKVAEEELVTVLYGYPAPASKRGWIDDVEFKGGVAKNIPASTANRWSKGLRPDGKKSAGRVSIHVVANEATTADYIAAVGIESVTPAAMAAMLDSTDINALVATMSDDQLEGLVRQLQSRKARRNRS